MVVSVSLLAIIGMSFDDNSFAKKRSKFILWIIFLSGSLFFYSYQAYLTSALALPSKSIPFETPEGLLKTDFKYVSYFLLIKAQFM